MDEQAIQIVHLSFSCIYQQQVSCLTSSWVVCVFGLLSYSVNWEVLINSVKNENLKYLYFSISYSYLNKTKDSKVIMLKYTCIHFDKYYIILWKMTLLYMFVCHDSIILIVATFIILYIYLCKLWLAWYGWQVTGRWACGCWWCIINDNTVIQAIVRHAKLSGQDGYHYLDVIPFYIVR